MDEINIRRPDDFHIHLRDYDRLPGFAADVAADFARVLAMPNTTPPLTTPKDLRDYGAAIAAATPDLGYLPCFKVMQDHRPEDIRLLKQAGAVAGKLYPRGATTNSDDGVDDPQALDPVFEAMEDEGLVLCIHGEDPSAPVLQREERFLPEFRRIRQSFPQLKMILEHVSTAAGVRAVKDAPAPTAATVTVQHLLYTFDDLAGGLLKPHLFCKPILKESADQEAIANEVLSGNPRFFFGSDSAPHSRGHKEAACCSAGCYTAPVALPLLLSFFEARGALDRVEAFVSQYGAEFYGLELNQGTVTFHKERWEVLAEYHGTVPVAAGESLDWRLSSSPTITDTAASPTRR